MSRTDKITIQYNDGEKDRVRGQTKNPTTLCTVSAWIQEYTGDQQIMAAQRGVFISHKFKVRYKPFVPLVESTCPGKPLQVIYKGKTYDVKAWNGADQLKQFVILSAREAL